MNIYPIINPPITALEENPFQRPPIHGGGGVPQPSSDFVLTRSYGDSNNAFIAAYPMSQTTGFGTILPNVAAYAGDMPYPKPRTARNGTLYAMANGSSDTGVYALSYDEDGLVKQGNKLVTSEGNNFNVEVVIGTDDRAWIFDVTEANGDFKMRAAEISAGDFVQVGNILSGSAGANIGGPKAMAVMDGRAVVIHQRSDVFGPADFRAFSFDGTDWTANQVFQPSSGFWAYELSPTHLYCVTDDTLTLEIYSYSAAGGFALVQSIAFDAINPNFPLWAQFTVDSVTGKLWISQYNNDYTENRLSVFSMSGATLVEEAVIVPDYEAMIYGLANNDTWSTTKESFADAVLLKRTGSTFNLLAGSITASNSQFIPVPL